MDTQETIKGLSEIFGISPDYDVIFTEGEYVEFLHLPPYSEEWMKTYIPPYRMATEEIGTSKHRFHLNEHVAFLDNGTKVTAQFAVFHPAKRVWLRVLHLADPQDPGYYVRLEKYHG